MAKSALVYDLFVYVDLGWRVAVPAGSIAMLAMTFLRTKTSIYVPVKLKFCWRTPSVEKLPARNVPMLLL